MECDNQMNQSGLTHQTAIYPPKLKYTLKCVSEQGENLLNQKYLMDANRYTQLFNSYLCYLDDFPY